MSDVPKHIRAAGREAASMYARLLSEGYTHLWAEMCALQQPPGVRGTDRAVMQNRLNEQWLDDMPPDHARRLLREAKKAGINVSGKYYMSGLADKRGHLDPAAWIDSAADIRRVAKERNLTVRGVVDVQGRQVERPKSKPLSERLIRKFSAAERKLHPNKKPQELRELVIDKYAPRWKKK